MRKYLVVGFVVLFVTALTPGISNATASSVVGKVCQSHNNGVVKTCEWLTVEYNVSGSDGIKDYEEEWASITSSSGSDLYIMEAQDVYIGPAGNVAEVIEETGATAGGENGWTASGTGSVTVHGFYAICDGNDLSQAKFRFLESKPKNSYVTTDYLKGDEVPLPGTRCTPGGGKDGP